MLRNVGYIIWSDILFRRKVISFVVGTPLASSQPSSSQLLVRCLRVGDDLLSTPSDQALRASYASMLLFSSGKSPSLSRRGNPEKTQAGRQTRV
jgi:hypothetical protein